MVENLETEGMLVRASPDLCHSAGTKVLGTANLSAQLTVKPVVNCMKGLLNKCERNAIYFANRVAIREKTVLGERMSKFLSNSNCL